MELLLHYIWKYRLYQHELKTTEGVPLEVIDVGIPNTDAGPDFFNAKVKIGGEVWAGNIEIHTDPRDWIRHNHQLQLGDPACGSQSGAASIQPSRAAVAPVRTAGATQAEKQL